MGALKQAMITAEEMAYDAAREQASEAYYLLQDFMHEQRDLIRENIEIAILDSLDMESEDDADMQMFFDYMGFADEDDYHVWLDEQASEALAEEGMGEWT